MSQVVTLPPQADLLPDGTKLGGWWHAAAEAGRIICDVCPRGCSLKPGDRGFCFVRENRDGQMVLSTYGRSTGFCIDPIEKKPLNHFLPGTRVFSMGTAGCNMASDHHQMSHRLIGSLGEAVIKDFVNPHNDDRLIVTTEDETRTEHLGNRSSYTYQFEAFTTAIRSGVPARTDAADAVKTMRLIDEGYLAVGMKPRPTP